MNSTESATPAESLSIRRRLKPVVGKSFGSSPSCLGRWHPEHDGALVADVVAESAQRHAQPCRLHLTGPAGGGWAFGSRGPTLELDAVELCRILSGRGRGTGLLTTEVPF